MQSAAVEAALLLLDSSDDSAEREGGAQPKEKKRRKATARPDYWQSPWGLVVRSGDWIDNTTKYGRESRRKFRLPPQLVLEIKDKLVALGFSDSDWSCGRRRAPLLLLILGALRVLEYE